VETTSCHGQTEDSQIEPSPLLHHRRGTNSRLIINVVSRGREMTHVLFIGSVCILRYVKYSVYSHSSELPVGVVVCILPSNPIVWIRYHVQ